MKSFLKYLAVLLSGFFILFLFLFVLIAILSTREVIVEDNSFLHMRLSGAIPEYIAPDPFEELLGKPLEMDMNKIRDNLEKAATDERINGVILDINFLRIGLAKINELHEMIIRYKASGKKIFAYLEYATTRDYLTALACDSIFIPANGNIFLTGIASEVTFYKGFFDKIGVKADFVHVGDYKSAPDVYTRQEMTPEHREELNTILDQYYKAIVSKISEFRNLTEDRVRDLINNQTGFAGYESKSNGLADGNYHFEEIKDKFNNSNDRLNSLDARDYAIIPASSLNIRNKERIAVIYVTGTIAPGADVEDPLLGKIAGSATLVRNIKRAANSKTTKAIILKIDSPGGSGLAANEIWKEIMKAKEKKPVIAVISDYGASGGYYIAMAADSLITNPMSLVGSIGVFAGKFSFGNLYNKLDMKTEFLKRGKNANLFSTSQEWSESERAVIQRLINGFYVDFVSKAADNRNKSYEEVDAIAGGRVYTGQECLANGLVDLTGTFYDAIDIAKQLSGIDENTSVRLSFYPSDRSLISELYGIIKVFSEPVLIINRVTERFEVSFQNQPLTLMPFQIEWN